MARDSRKQSNPKEQKTLPQRQSPYTNQDQHSGQEGTNPSGNQDQFNIDGIKGQYGSSRDQPGPFDSEELYKTSSRKSSSSQSQKPSGKHERKRTNS
jgi:hypothetical protein